MNPNFSAQKTVGEGHCACGSGAMSTGCTLSHPPLFDSNGELNIQQVALDQNLIRRVEADETAEYYDLGGNEREKVLEEIHGVADVMIEEGPDFVQERLNQMEIELNKLSRNESLIAYDRAVFLSPSIVKDTDFRLMFLRADLFDPRKAARRLTNFFQSKVELFGEDKLLDDITLNDLDEDDMTTLTTGGFMLLPSKDRAGRTIMFVSQKSLKYKSWKNLVRTEVMALLRAKMNRSHLLFFPCCDQFRVMWYVKMIAVQELEAQVKGFVSIFYNLDICEHEPQYMEAMKRVKRVLTDSLPYRNVAVHYCLNDPRMLRALAIFKLVTGKNHRLRFRTHYGMFEIPRFKNSYRLTSPSSLV